MLHISKKNLQFRLGQALLVLLLFCYAAGAKAQGNYFIGAGLGVGVTVDNSLSAAPQATFKNKLSWDFPVRMGTYIGDKKRVWLGLNSTDFSIEAAYKNNVVQPKDPLVPVSRLVELSALQVSLDYDHRIFTTGKFEMFGAAGIRSQFAGKPRESTTYGDGREAETSQLMYNFQHFLFGIGVGAVARYTLNEKAAIVLLPDYTHYFGGFNKGSDGSLRQVRLAIGTEIRL